MADVNLADLEAMFNSTMSPDVANGSVVSTETNTPDEIPFEQAVSMVNGSDPVNTFNPQMQTMQNVQMTQDVQPVQIQQSSPSVQQQVVSQNPATFNAGGVGMVNPNMAHTGMTMNGGIAGTMSFGGVNQATQAPATIVSPSVAPIANAVSQMGNTFSVGTSTPMSQVANDFSIGLPDSIKASLIDAGVDVGEIGMKVSTVPIEKYKASTKKIDRIGFISNVVIPVRSHYIDGKGSIICFRGKCCEVLGNSTVRYLFPIVVYQTDDEGNVIGGKVSLMMLSAGNDLYKSIQTIHKGSAGMGGIDHVDLLVTCTDDQYQKITLVQAGPAIWRQYSQIAEFLNNQWLQNADKAYMAVGRKVDLDSFCKLIEMDTEPDNNSTSGNTFDPSANQDLSKFFS